MARSLCGGRGFAPELGLREDVTHLLPFQQAEDCLNLSALATIHSG